MQATTTRMAALLAMTAAFAVFAFVIASQTHQVLSQSTVAACGSDQADDDDDTAAGLAQQEEDEQQGPQTTNRPPNSRNSRPPTR